MSHVFISYAREDMAVAKRLAALLRSRGLEVWWDTRLKAGEVWDEVIEDALKNSSCIIVVWSRVSVSKRWVQEEASFGRERGILIPVIIEDVRPPLHFRHIQHEVLSDWDGDIAHLGLRRLLEAVDTISMGAGAVSQGPRGQVGVTAYLRSLREGSAELREAKVIFIGDGGAGKTSLLKLLTGKSFNPAEPQTHGLVTDRYIMQCGAEHIIANAWDFGGQEIMHSMHQFFLTKRSLYVLVLDGRKEEDPEYWLEQVCALASKPPIIVALNKADENPGYDVNRKFLQDKYRSILGFFKISCSSRVGISQFFKALEDGISGIDHLKSIWPYQWFAVRSSIESLSDDYISFDEFEKICRQHGVDDIDSIDTLADLLHDVGISLHYNSVFLRETNVINPIWITTAAYSIVNSEILSKKKGIMQRSDLALILGSPRYPPRKQDYILALMKRFGLCVSIDDENILVPDLLPVEEPSFIFKTGDSLRVEVEYNYIPRSIMARLIVNMRQDIHQQLVWRTGVVLRSDSFEAKALVRADYREKRIYIYVNGKERKDYFSIIRRVLLEINLSFASQFFKEMVPCICKDCKRRRTPYFYEYDYMVRARRKGKKTVNCQNSAEDVLLSQLFEGIENEDDNSYEGWDVFLSYSSCDLHHVERVVSDLAARGVSYWWDGAQIAPGESISKKIELGLRRSRIIVPFLSHAQIRSGWCRAEYGAILHGILSEKVSQKVVPLIVDDLSDEDIPLLLRDFRCEHLYDQLGYERFLSVLCSR